MKNTLIFFLFWFTGFALLAQQPSKTEIISSGSYYYGTSTATNENQARDEAIREISEQIAVKVSSQFEMKSKETNMNFQETASSIINTYSMATLTEVESIRTMKPDGKVEVFAYVPREQVKKLFNERKNMVFNMFMNGKKNEETGNLAFALKNYYFGIVLLKSIPEEHVVVQDINLTLEIPKTINGILQGVVFTLVNDTKLNDKEREVSFEVSYNGKHVNLMHFRFWDGYQIGGSGQVRDGKTAIRLLGSSIDFDNLKVYTEYEYFNARKEYTAVEELWELVVRPEFENLRNIKLSKPALPKSEIAGKTQVHGGTQLVLKFENTTPATEQILINANKFIVALQNEDELNIANEYEKDTFLLRKINDYIRYNQPKPLIGQTDAVVNETRLGYEIRKIEVHHMYTSMNKQSIEYLVLDFDKSGALLDFNLCITDDLYEKFVKQAEYGNDWGNRQEIIKFIVSLRPTHIDLARMSD